MMRARNRHSASNYLFAAFLELVIMGIFIVIAQPQLRESLFELFEPPAGAIPALVPPAPAPVQATVAVDANYSGLTETAAGTLSSTGQPAGWSMTMASYAPFEQFEAFAVSSGGAALPDAGVAGQESRVEKRVAGYAPSVGATQLSALDWNIASAGRPLSPVSNWPSRGWSASQPAEAAYRDTYPPPYGTQSQWK